MTTKQGDPFSRTLHANRVPLAAITVALALSLVAACSVGDARLVAPVTPSDTSHTPVAPTPATVSVTAPATQIAASSTMPLRAVAIDASGDTVPGASFTWNSSNPQVAAVSSDGVLTAVQAGATSITASTGSITSNALAMTVTAPIVPPVVNTIALTAPSYSIKLLQTVQATAVASDASGKAIKGVAFTWSSSNPLVASVSNTGLITAHLTGMVKITATSGSKSSPAVKFNVTP